MIHIFTADVLLRKYVQKLSDRRHVKNSREFLADLKDPSKKTSENEFKSFCTHKRFDNTYEKLAYDSLFIRLHT